MAGTARRDGIRPAATGCASSDDDAWPNESRNGKNIVTANDHPSAAHNNQNRRIPLLSINAGERSTSAG